MAECTPGQHPYSFQGNYSPSVVTFRYPSDFEPFARAEAEAMVFPPEVISRAAFSVAGGLDGAGNVVPQLFVEVASPYGGFEFDLVPSLVCTGGYVEVPGSEPFDGDLNWGDASHMLQAVMVLVLVALFFAGYTSGKRP